MMERSHDGAGMDIFVTKTVGDAIIDGGVRQVGEVAVHGVVVAVHAVVVRRGEGGFIQVCGSVGMIFGVIWECPKLGFSPTSPHNFQHSPPLHVSSHTHFLLLHVYLHAIHTYITNHRFIQLKLNLFQ